MDGSFANCLKIAAPLRRVKPPFSAECGSRAGCRAQRTMLKESRHPPVLLILSKKIIRQRRSLVMRLDVPEGVCQPADMSKGEKRFSGPPRVRGRALALAGLGLAVWGLSASFLRADDYCDICKTTVAGDGYLLKDHYHKETRLACKACTLLTVRCGICGMPVPAQSGLQLPDGRT